MILLGSLVSKHAFAEEESVEHGFNAAGPLDATTLLGALDVHIYRGLVVQLGLGVELIEDDSNELGRVGVLYEFEFGKLTLSPQFHYDVTSAEGSLVFGVAIGRNF